MYTRIGVCVCTLHSAHNYCVSLMPVDFATLWREEMKKKEKNLTDKQKIYICVKFAMHLLVHLCSHINTVNYTHQKRNCTFSKTICLYIYVYDCIRACMRLNGSLNRRVKILEE